jgi:hypothetical protein
MGNSHCEENQPVNEQIQALERFLNFYTPQYSRKPDTEQEIENRIDQMENIFVVVNYEDLRKCS